VLRRVWARGLQQLVGRVPSRGAEIYNAQYRNLVGIPGREAFLNFDLTQSSHVNRHG